MDGLERMSAADVRRFIEGKTTLVFDPQTGEEVACVTYGPDGICRTRFSNGQEDSGEYGFVDDCYWTRYKQFRGGGRNVFYLVSRGTGQAQAYFSDGRKAFLQVHEDGREVRGPS